MLKFLVDEDMPRSTTQILKNIGFETFDVREVGLRGKSDNEIFVFAQENHAVIVTADIGFGNLLRYPLGSHAGIIIVHDPNEMSNVTVNDNLRESCLILSEHEIRGNLVILEPGRIRIKRFD
ncbi:MAG: DUF5615 family PIN-like protein [Dissulfurispiraceae bacterium]